MSSEPVEGRIELPAIALRQAHRDNVCGKLFYNTASQYDVALVSISN
jgi:hypothetical protein